MYFKTVILIVNIRFISLPKVIKKVKSTPQTYLFFRKIVIFWKFYHVSKNRDTVLRFAYIQTISQNKNEKQSRLGVESRIVKISVFPQNAKTMSYD